MKRLKWTERREEERLKCRNGGVKNIYIYSNQTTNKIIFFFLSLSYSTHLSLDVYCSGEAKNFAYSSTAAALFCDQ